jgi:hypothetical protein
MDMTDKPRLRARIVFAAFVALSLCLGATSAAWAAQPQAQQVRMTDAQVKRAIIRASMASYPGACPCPYSVDRAGRSCGRRSAYSRAGGYAMICYASDVTPAMVVSWRKEHQQ